MAETASLKRPHEDTEETKETTNGSERVEVRQSGYFFLIYLTLQNLPFEFFDRRCWVLGTNLNVTNQKCR